MHTNTLKKKKKKKILAMLFQVLLDGSRLDLAATYCLLPAQRDQAPAENDVVVSAICLLVGQSTKKVKVVVGLDHSMALRCSWDTWALMKRWHKSKNGEVGGSEKWCPRF